MDPESLHIWHDAAMLSWLPWCVEVRTALANRDDQAQSRNNMSEFQLGISYQSTRLSLCLHLDAMTVND